MHQLVSSLHNIPLSSIYSTVDSVRAEACWGGEGNLLWWSGSWAGGAWSGASSFNLLNSHHRETHIVIFIKSAFFIRYYLVKSYITEELFVGSVGTQKNGCWYVQGCCTGTHCTGCTPRWCRHWRLSPSREPLPATATNPALTSSY